MIGRTVISFCVLVLLGIAPLAGASTQDLRTALGTAGSRVAAGAAQPQPAGHYMIQLRSRQFVPLEGVEAAARSRIAARPGTSHILLQLRDIPDLAAHAALASRGIRLLNYLPDRAWFASIDSAALAHVDSTPEIRWLGEIEVADKLPARLVQGRPLAYAVNSDGSLSLQMSYFDDVSEAEAQAVAAQYKGVVVERAAFLHWLSIRLPVEQLKALAADDAVRWLAEVPPTPTPFNDSIRSRIRVNEVQGAPYNLTGSGVNIGIWDCTVVWPHADFAGRLIQVTGQRTTPCTTNDATQNHATHVAGIMAGSGAASQSQGGTPLQWKGMAPGAPIFSYDFLSPMPEVASAIATFNIDLSQNSWGFVPATDDCDQTYGNYNNLAPDYDQIVRGSAGKAISVVFAAGNYQGTCGTWNSITPPATAKNVIAVGMTNSLDDSLVAVSSVGPTDDGRTKPDVVAPGFRNDVGGIVSTIPSITSTSTYGTEYGTSMSAPAVTGMLALMLQQYRISTGLATGNPLPSTLKAMAIHGAVDLGNPGPDFRFGWGRVDAKNSVDLVRRSKYREGSVADSHANTYAVNVLGCEAALKTTLVWDDPAATANALVAYINDLDLRVVSPNNITYYPWQLDGSFPANAATTGPNGDHVNNVEQVLVGNPIAGTWTIVVSGTAVPMNAPQTYSLVTEAFATAPIISSLNPPVTRPGAQIVLRGDNFGCAQGSSVLTFTGGVTATVPAGSWTDGAITVTVPANALSGNISLTTTAGMSNQKYLTIVRSLYLPAIMHDFPPVYHWVDASDGLRVADGDEVTTAVSLPFPFKFYGNTYDTAAVSTNGFISFAALDQAYFQSSCLPTTAAPNNSIYAFWTDLNATITLTGTPPGGIWYKPLGATAVVEWQNVPRYGTTDLETFEIILGADNSVIIQYQSVANVNDVTVGIENDGGTAAAQSYCHRSDPPFLVGTAPAGGSLFYYTSP
jgi:hypothetical protein